MNARLKELQQTIKTKNDAVCAIWDKAGDESLPKDVIDQVKTYNKEIEECELEAKSLLEQDQMREAAKARGRLPLPADKDDRRPSDRFTEAKTLGQAFLDDPAIKAWLQEIAPNGRVADRQTLQSPHFQAKSLITGSGTTSGGALTQIDYKPVVDAAPFRILKIRDLVTVGETGSDLVVYPQITGYTDNAAPTPEATSSAAPTAPGSAGALVNVAGGGYKPESGMTLQQVNAAVKTIAAFMPATTRALADAPQIRTLIDTFLGFSMERSLEDQMISGDGNGEDFLGVLNTPSIQTQAFTSSDILITTRKARTKLMTPGRVTPTAYVFNPLDWETIDLTKSSQGIYYFGGPQILGNPRLWGVPVVESEAVPQGTGILADWKYAMLWDRMQTAIMMSNSHADWFIRNLVAVLAEMRAAFGVTYTKAFCTIAFS